MALLTREQILKATDLETETVPVPEWGGDVIVTTLTAGQRDQFEAGMLDEKGKVSTKDVRARLAVFSMVDEQGNRLFKSKDIPQLSEKSAAAMERIYTVAARLNRMSESDIDELAKNS